MMRRQSSPALGWQALVLVALLATGCSSGTPSSTRVAAPGQGAASVEPARMLKVARVLGISGANVRVRLHRARAAVRARLESYFREVPR